MPLTDVIIIGSGIAALTAAKRLSETKNVIIFTKSRAQASNSFLAQGGIACAVDKEDHWTDHAQDTMIAGCFHNDADRVDALVKEGPQYIKQLIREGMNFDRDEDGNLQLGKEGAHLKRRILHAGGDATGRELSCFLLEEVKKRVSIKEHEMAVDLIVQNNRCVGVTTKNEKETVNHYFANAIILATGGCGGLFSCTSNDPSITGDGIAMAYRAGAEVIDMEFIQFHPTMLYKDGRTHGLISEAVRGEGAYLINSAGKRIMETVHPLKDLAPRDIVARTIYREIQRGEKIYLDISPVKQFSFRFPTISNLCEEQKINLAKEKIPVTPGAHFLMGGVRTNQVGETSVEGLFAVGEIACTGVHGANRIASNSLLEGVVFGNRLADYLLSRKVTTVLPMENPSVAVEIDNIQLPAKTEIKEKMMHLTGVIRDEEGLTKMKNWLESYHFPQNSLTGMPTEKIEIINMLMVAWLITTSALVRTESRGAHFRSDYPACEADWLRRLVTHKHKERASILV